MPDDDAELAAGAFLPWLQAMRRTIEGAGDAEVPCDGCTACCTASQFVTIEPDETDTLGHIPRELLVPAPRRPPGHVVLGYDDRGHCPMLVDGRCSIYEHRPRACRRYDCRTLAASGIDVDADKPMLRRQVRRWSFSCPTEGDRMAAAAVRAAGAFLQSHPEVVQGTTASSNPTELAALAIEVSTAFLTPHADTTGVRVEIGRRTRPVG